MVLKRTLGEKMFDFFNVCFMLLIIFITLYPMMYVVFASLSDPNELSKHLGMLWRPLGFTLNGYELVLANENIITGYKNTLFYVVFGTAANLLMTSLGAYVLSRKWFMLRNPILLMITFTMFFSGGIIPLFLILNSIGLINTRLAMIIPNVISVWNLIVMKTSFEAIPAGMEESAKIDGANDFIVFAKIILPLSLPIIAVMGLFYGVANWSEWFSAVMYLKDRELFPLQLFMREILILSNDAETMRSMVMSGETEAYSKLVKYCTIIVSTVPILLVYPFIQKYFVKGIMIGAVKG